MREEIHRMSAELPHLPGTRLRVSSSEYIFQTAKAVGPGGGGDRLI